MFAPLHCDAEGRFLEFRMLRKGNDALLAIAFASDAKGNAQLAIAFASDAKALRPLLLRLR